MGRIGAALLAALLVAGLTASLTAMNPAGERLPAPDPGEVSAARLSNGAPVFLVRDGADRVRVVSAVSTHLDHVVAWCDDSGVFVEPVGATRYDRAGRWLGGPAPTGLAPYQARLSADGRSVLVGSLREPPARWEEGDRAQADWGPCPESEGVDGGVFPPGTDPASAVDVDGLGDVPLGRFAAVTATVDFSHRPARLCAPSPDGRCPAEAMRVRDFFWDHLWDRPVRAHAISASGSFLVRRVGPELLDRAAVLVRLDATAPGYTYNVTRTLRDESGPPTRSAEYVGMLERVSVAGDEVVLHAVEGFRAVAGFQGPPPPTLPATLDRVPLRRPLGMVHDRHFRVMGDDLDSPDTLAGRLRVAGGPIAVRFRYVPGERLWSVHVFDTLEQALADY